MSLSSYYPLVVFEVIGMLCSSSNVLFYDGFLAFHGEKDSAISKKLVKSETES